MRLNGALHHLWGAVDQHGVVLDILVQDRRNGAAAKRFFRQLLAGLKYEPRGGRPAPKWPREGRAVPPLGGARLVFG